MTILACSIAFLAVGATLAVAQTTSRPSNPMAEGGNDPDGFDMAPETRVEVVEAAVRSIPTTLPAGPAAAPT